MNLTEVSTSCREGAFLSFPSPDSEAVTREELALAGKRGANILLIGVSCSSRERVEASLMLQEPVIRWEPGDELVLLSPDSGGSHILHEVGLLTHADQLRLLEWLEQSDGRTRVACTSSDSLFELVQAGRFLDKLFYRLNTVTQVVR